VLILSSKCSPCPVMCGIYYVCKEQVVFRVCVFSVLLLSPFLPFLFQLSGAKKKSSFQCKPNSPLFHCNNHLMDGKADGFLLSWTGLDGDQLHRRDHIGFWMDRTSGAPSCEALKGSIGFDVGMDSHYYIQLLRAWKLSVRWCGTLS
jgi:hypothetical protein